MPIIESGFSPGWLLRSRHVQTSLPAVFGGWHRLDFRRERIGLPDGDFLDLDWIERGNNRVVVLCSGLEGSSRDPGMLRLARVFSSARWDVLSWNYRGCSGEVNLLPCSYHSGATGDLSAVLERAGSRRIALVGCSLGGNLILKYLGERPLSHDIVGAVAISPPVDLSSTVRALDGNPENAVYRGRLIASLKAKVVAKAAALPAEIDISRLRGIDGFADFDEYVTAPLHGFRSADDYWTSCSARRFLGAVNVPALILSSMDDPFLLPPSYPEAEARRNPRVFLETPSHGGHLGFVSGFPPRFDWAAKRALAFLEGQCSGSDSL